jgi:hypothetical protein
LKKENNKKKRQKNVKMREKIKKKRQKNVKMRQKMVNRLYSPQEL